MKRAVEEYRVLLLDQRGTGRSTPVGATIPGDTPAGPGRLPRPLPGRQHRPRLRGDPRRARLAAVDDARPELRRVHDAHLPLVRARGPARRRCSPAACRRSAGPSDDIYGATYRQAIAAQRALLRPLPGRPGAGPRHLRPPRGRGRPAPGGDRLTARRFRQLGMWLGDSAGFELLHHVIELPFGSQRVPHRRGARRAVAAEPDLRDAPRVVVRGRRPDALVRGPPPAGRDRRGGAVHGRARVPLDVGRLRRAPRPPRGGDAARRPPVAAPLRRGPARPQRGPRRRRRSTPTTCTWSGRSPWRRPRSSAGCGRGRRTSTSTTGCARTASGCSGG